MAQKKRLSDRMAEAFAQYINELGLTDEDGTVLTLTASDEGIYQSGTYYEYLKEVIEDSLENFLEDTQFPYDASSSSNGGFGGRMGGNKGDFRRDDLTNEEKAALDEQFGGQAPGGMAKGDFPGGGNIGGDEAAQYAADSINRGGHHNQHCGFRLCVQECLQISGRI